MKNLYKNLKLWQKLVIIFVIVLLGWFGYTKLFKKTTTQPQYQTATVSKGNIVETVTATGQVSSANNTPVVTQVTGAITKLYVQNGDVVKAGEPIATIQLDQDSQQRYIQQLASFQNAKNSLESAKVTQKSLKSSMITAENNFLINILDKGKKPDSAAYKTAKEDMKAAEDKYKNQTDVINQAQTALNSASMSLQQVSPTISAPISGTIGGLFFQVGSVIPAQAITGNSNQNTSQTIANITTSSIPIVSVDFTEIDIPNVKVGQKATVMFDAYPEKTFTGKVFSIDTTGTVSSGVTNYPVTINLDSENASIYPNMSATANVIVASKDNVLMAPLSAIQNQNGQQVARVLKDGQLTYVPVETGISSDSNVEIVSGLNEGDVVVTAVTQTSTTTKNSRQGSSPFGSFRGGFGGGGGNIRIQGRQ